MNPRNLAHRMDADASAAVRSEKSIEMRSDQPYKRKENPMSLDTCVSRTQKLCTLPVPMGSTRSTGTFPLSFAAARVESGPGSRSVELGTVRTGWSPDSRSQLDGASRRSSQRGGQFRTTLRRAGSDGASTVCTGDGSRAHLEALLRAGLTVSMLISLTGLSSRDLALVRRRGVVYVDTAIVDRVLSVPFHPADHRRMTPVIGAQRRIRGLVAMGFTFEDLARRLRRPVATIASLPGSGLITASLWVAIAKLYDELSMTAVAPDPEIRDWARTIKRWAPPLAWDDDEIDDPRALPHCPRGPLGVDEVAIARRIGGEREVALSPDDYEVILELAVRWKWELQRVADVLDTSKETASKRLTRYRGLMNRQSEDVVSADTVDAA